MTTLVGCYSPSNVVRYDPGQGFVEENGDSAGPTRLAAVPARPGPGKSLGLEPAPGKGRLAVMELEPLGDVDQSFAEIVTNTLKDEIQEQGGYMVVSREEIEALATRLAMRQQAGDCTSDECLADMGKALGTRLMVYGSISRVGGTYVLSIRLLDTDTKVAIRRVNERCKCSGEDLFDLTHVAVSKLMGN